MLVEWVAFQFGNDRLGGWPIGGPWGGYLGLNSRFSSTTFYSFLYHNIKYENITPRRLHGYGPFLDCERTRRH